MADAQLFDLMTWMSPAWPIGAFAHSGGLEWAVEAGHVYDRASTLAWLSDLLELGPIYNDAIVFLYAWRAADARDIDRLADITELGSATQTSAERQLEAHAQGAAFRRIALSTLDDASFTELLELLDADEIAYPVMAAILFATHNISLEAGLTAYLHGIISNYVSAAQRLVPLGQTDGQSILRAMRTPIIALTDSLIALPDSDPFEQLSSCTLVADIGAMLHETQYTRLFRT